MYVVHPAHGPVSLGRECGIGHLPYGIIGHVVLGFGAKIARLFRVLGVCQMPVGRG